MPSTRVVTAPMSSVVTTAKAESNHHSVHAALLPMREGGYSYSPHSSPVIRWLLPYPPSSSRNSGQNRRWNDGLQALAATEVMPKAIEWLRQKGIASGEEVGRTAQKVPSAATSTPATALCWSKSTAKPTSWPVATCSRSCFATWRCRCLPGVEYVTTDETFNCEREKSIEMGRDDLEGKPEQMKEKIVEVGSTSASRNWL